jgi:hypothetical protein
MLFPTAKPSPFRWRAGWVATCLACPLLRAAPASVPAATPAPAGSGIEFVDKVPGGTGIEFVDAESGDLTVERVNERYRKGQQLARDGDRTGALREFLWCFDRGMAVESFRGVRLSFLLTAIMRLAEDFPPARRALVDRCGAAEIKAIDQKDLTAAADYAALCGVLGWEKRLLRAYDHVPAADPRRAVLGPRVYKALIERRRYKDALAAIDYAKMVASFARQSALVSAPTNLEPAREQKLVALRRRAAVTVTLDHIETLAGAGELEHARELAQKVIALEPTRDTKDAIAARLTRAGQPGLLKSPSTQTPEK